MRHAMIILLVAYCLMGCAITYPNHAKAVAPEDLTTIKYTGTFEIMGTDINGIEIDHLPQAIVEHHRNHPNAAYELYAEVKCVTETSDEIIAVIRAAGVELRYYWAPTSDFFSEASPGKYGPGHVNILEEESTRN